MDKLQWGNRKRLLFVKVKDLPLNGKSDCDGGSSGGGGSGSAVVKKKITSREIFSHSDMDKLQWGNRKRLLFVKIKDSPLNGKSDGDGGSSGGGGAVVKKKITSRVVDNNITNNVNNCSKDGNVLPPVPSPHRSNSENPCIMETRVCSRKNIKLRDEDCWIDQISRLPDELLVSILSCLSLKEAAASSILSRRWRYLWTFISKLDFEGSDLWTTFTSKPDFDIYDFYPTIKREASIRECWEYVGWVDNVLGLRDKSAAVEELRISFSLNEAHQSYIDRWIRFALAKKVVRLDLNLVRTFRSRDDYTFPYKLLCGNDSHSWGFKDLRLIRMVSVNMSDGALEIFLRSCPLLEEIFFAKCDGLSTVKIVNPSPALKRLTIVRCFNLQSVEVRDSNLVYLMYRGLGFLKHFLLKNVPLLAEMNVGGLDTIEVEKFLKKFSSYLPQLEKLTIEKELKICIMEARLICSSVKMSNLKQLVWKFVGFFGDNNLMPLTILIGALPLLQRLVLMSYGDRVKAEVDVSHHHLKIWTITKTTYTYSHLKQVEFVGYHGEMGEFEILAHILENAAALEEVIIHPAKVTCIRNETGEYTKQDIDAFRACAKAQLTTRLPSTATLKIL